MQIPINDTIPTNDSALVEIPLAIRVSFYVGCGLGIIFHLPIIIASLIVCYRSASYSILPHILTLASYTNTHFNNCILY